MSTKAKFTIYIIFYIYYYILNFAIINDIICRKRYKIKGFKINNIYNVGDTYDIFGDSRK